jgi:hypothetical protein
MSQIANLRARWNFRKAKFRKAAALFVVVAGQGRATHRLENPVREKQHFELPLERIRVPLPASLTVGPTTAIQRRTSRRLDLEKNIDFVFAESKDPSAPLASG